MIKKQLFGNFVAYFLLILLVSGVGVWNLLQTYESTRQNVVIERELGGLTAAEHIVQASFSERLGDVLVLAHIPETSRYLLEEHDDKGLGLPQLLVSICQAYRVYDQIRLIHVNGQEWLRVNYDAGQCELVPPHQLQNKAERYYIQDSRTLRNGEVSVSILDLNVEHGVIEKPYKPTIRYTAAVFDSAGNVSGFIVLNYLAESMLDKLFVHEHHEGLPESYLLNGDGYYLTAPHDDSKTFAFMFGREADSFAHDHPAVWQAVLAGESRIKTKDALFLIKPLQVPTGSLPVDADLAKVQTGRHWYAVREISDAVLYQDSLLYGPQRDIWLVLYLSVVFVGSFLLAERRSRELKRREIARMLQNSEAEYRELIDHVSAIILRMDFAGRVTYFNHFAEQFFGYRSDEILGRHVVGTIVPATESQTQRDLGEMVDAILANPQGYVVNENENIKRSGERVVVRWANRVIHDENGATTGVLCIGTDVTAEKQTYEQLASLKVQAEQASRAKSAFLANMSHEIRTPMNAIVGMTHVLKQTTLMQEQRQYLDIIESNGAALLTLINDILDFSKIEAGQLKVDLHDFHLGRLLFEVVATLRVSAEAKGIRLSVDGRVAANDWFLGDAARMRQVLMNLVGNAVKFTERGEVHLTVVREYSDEGRRLVTIRIVDSGIGISEEAQSRLFTRFEQADSSTTRKYGGTGLGLAISKQLVELMGGSLSVQSKLGEGSVFEINLRLQQGQEPVNDTQAPQFSGDEKYHAHVLVVDDVASNCLVAQKLLEQFGITSDSAENGEVALKRVSETVYDLILMDIQMPVMDGYRASRIIRRQSLDALNVAVPIVALTGNTTKSDLDEAFDSGMNDYMTKPVSLDVLAEKLYTWLPNSCRQAPENPFLQQGEQTNLSALK